MPINTEQYIALVGVFQNPDVPTLQELLNTQKDIRQELPRLLYTDPNISGLFLKLSEPEFINLVITELANTYLRNPTEIEGNAPPLKLYNLLERSAVAENMAIINRIFEIPYIRNILNRTIVIDTHEYKYDYNPATGLAELKPKATSQPKIVADRRVIFATWLNEISVLPLGFEMLLQASRSDKNELITKLMSYEAFRNTLVSQATLFLLSRLNKPATNGGWVQNILNAPGVAAGILTSESNVTAFLNAIMFQPYDTKNKKFTFLPFIAWLLDKPEYLPAVNKAALEILATTFDLEDFVFKLETVSRESDNLEQFVEWQASFLTEALKLEKYQDLIGFGAISALSDHMHIVHNPEKHELLDALQESLKARRAHFKATLSEAEYDANRAFIEPLATKYSSQSKKPQ